MEPGPKIEGLDLIVSRLPPDKRADAIIALGNSARAELGGDLAAGMTATLISILRRIVSVGYFEGLTMREASFVCDWMPILDIERSGRSTRLFLQARDPPAETKPPQRRN